MNIIFLGGLCPESERSRLHSLCNGPVQPAAQAFQWRIINGLESNAGERLMILSAYFVGTFPKYCKALRFKYYKWSSGDHGNAHNVPFTNLKVIQHFSKYRNLKRMVKTNKITGDPDIMIIYSAYFPFLMFARYAKLHFPRMKVCLVVTDLPQYMGLGSKRSWYHQASMRYSERSSISLIGNVDCFVLLTEAMNSKINVLGKPYIVIEGMTTAQEYSDEEEVESQEKTVLYSGTLHRRYGILRLLEAFSLTEDASFRLYVCGRGEASAEVAVAAKRDPRIKYLGVLEREAVVKLQRQCTLLVNPRQNNEEFTKYSFPSKIIEYMEAAKPVVTYKLDGIPQEYDDHLIYVKGDSVEDLASALENTLNLPHSLRRDIGEKARRFVVEKKNHIAQTRKILEMLDAL